MLENAPKPLVKNQRNYHSLENIESKKKSSSILIADSGKGIPRKNWKNIFRPGFSSKRRGWGLGLSLTMRIIKEIHQGDIRVLRSKPGETIFQIMLPV